MKFLKWTRNVLVSIVVFIAALVAVYFAGPRLKYNLDVAFKPSEIGADIAAYVAARDTPFQDIQPRAARQIVWADPETKSKTPYSLVYIHGFSATAAEIRPLPDLVAGDLGANLYFTRLAGHGRSNPDAMAEATVNDWINDYAEAIEIGRRLGDKVIVMAVSTGASIATWAMTQPDFARDTAAAIFISPNYGIQAQGEFLLTGPWARQLAHVLLGSRRSFEPANSEHAAAWTTNYPTDALFPMAQMVKLARQAPVEKISVPTFFIISDRDDVVRPDLTRKIASRWGAASELEDVGDTGGLSNHVLAGDILNPEMTEPMRQKISTWLSKTLQIR